MDRRHFVKTSIFAALANPIHAMTKTNSIQRKNRKKGHIAVVGAGAFGGWTAYHL
jgi:threonine dehydrogenase-like Zn-dependent dehydrogenase